jgi:UDP-glucose 4-epimerase
MPTSKKQNSKYILITGAAGYIGSVVTEELTKEGKHVIALDNLSQGYRESLVKEAEFIEGNLANIVLLDQLFRDYPIEAVVHLAALTLVGDSMIHPETYFQNNLVNSINLLNTMRKYEVKKLIFSSSCAIYGHPTNAQMDENTPKNPINPYGEAKLMFERILYWYYNSYGISSISLRYFNAAGASERCGEDHNPESHLIPNILKVALGQANTVSVFGCNYPTKDGSCIRDYVHVIDIARAHVLALQYLSTQSCCQAFNLGNGQGYSVLEVINTVKKVTGARITTIIRDPRPGDPPVLVADSRLAKTMLNWEPEYPSLNAIIESAYKWMKRHPYGYLGLNKPTDE